MEYGRIREEGNANYKGIVQPSQLLLAIQEEKMSPSHTIQYDQNGRHTDSTHFYVNPFRATMTRLLRNSINRVVLRPKETWSQMNQKHDTDTNSASVSVSFDMMLGV